MSKRVIARTAAYVGAAALAAALAFKPPLIDRAYAEKQKSAQVKFTPKEKKKLFKDFSKAVKKGDPEKVQELIDQGGKLINKERKTAALMTASKKGHLEVVKLLVEAGADVDAFDMNSYKTRETGWTPLMYAAHNYRLDVIDYFLEIGVDVDQPDFVGATPLMTVSYFKVKDVNKTFELIDYLISHGADVNATSNNGSTALMAAANNGRLKVVKKLVEEGADVNARSSAYGDTALYRAVEKDYWEIVKFLIEEGADFDSGTDWKVTPLMYAAAAGSLESLKILLKNGADVNLKDDEGLTALMRAARTVPCKISAEPEENETELQKKLREEKVKNREDSIKILKLLLSVKGIKVNAKDKSGKTALDHADDEEVRKLIKKHGAK